MRASLFAKATAATLLWVRVVSWASHALRPEDCFVALLQDGTCPLREESSQVRVPNFANPQQLLLATSGIYSPGLKCDVMNRLDAYTATASSCRFLPYYCLPTLVAGYRGDPTLWLWCS